MNEGCFTVELAEIVTCFYPECFSIEFIKFLFFNQRNLLLNVKLYIRFLRKYLKIMAQ